MSQSTFSAQCLTVHNPFNPMLGRETQLLDEPVPIRTLVPPSNKPVIVVRNGQYILRADWDQEVKDGDTLAVVFLPQGSGDDGGSNVLQVILMIVVIVVAAYTGVYVGGAEGLGMGAGYGAAAQAAVGMEGNPVINVTFEVLK
jgi:hypothetical protein